MFITSTQPTVILGKYVLKDADLFDGGSIAYRPGTDCEVAYILEKPEPAQAPSQFTPIGRQNAKLHHSYTIGRKGKT